MRRIQKSAIYRLFLFMIGFGIILAFIIYTGFERFINILFQTSPYWILAAIIVYATTWLFRTWRIEKFTIQAGERIKIFDLFRLYISGYALNVILPAKLGDVATVIYLKMKGIAIGRSTAIIIQTRVLDLFALLILSIPTFIVLIGRGSPEWIKTTLLICSFIVAVSLGIVFLNKHKAIHKVLEKLKARYNRNIIKLLAEKTTDAYVSYCEIVSNKRLLVFSIIISLIIWLIEALTCYIITIAVRTQISIVIIILSVSIANMGKSVPATPGAVGIYEGIVVAILSVFDVPFDVAIVIAILDHFLKNLFILAIGVPATVSLGVDISEVYKIKIV